MQPIFIELLLAKPKQVKSQHSASFFVHKNSKSNPKFLKRLKTFPVCQIKMIGFRLEHKEEFWKPYNSPSYF